ncbi:putative pyrroloquinoline-quinone binding quinoprotein [Micromonospora sp. M71_S20]|uniref:Hsp70 family protein n=1 Tax=Micromonospora sp. M71_S20 TaxID=592872 RepID=UPI000EAF8CFB|nr:Hsp70 family protein [Micromonospora sp. M71_S20]RLK13226.1 putative pyrroloquinoline-quinone binding quinoprotein [Micromonospora sp. M71_S20]
MAGQHEGYALGVDLGTSHTVAVLRRPDGHTRPLLVDGQPIIPSGVYADTDGLLHAGRDAQRLARTDPGRYEPNPKRRIDEPAVMLGGRRYPPADLLAATLHAVARAAVEAVGFLPPAVLTCPATWDAARRQVLADALATAGWPSAAEHTLSGPTPPGTRLLREPVAAARYYTQVLRRPVPVGGTIAVFDFGAGTLDVAVLRNEGADPWGDSGFTVVTAGGADDLGGLDLDVALLGRLGELVAEAHPARWERLTRPESATQWRERHELWENVRGAKEMLSRVTAAPVAVPGVEAAVTLTRADLERVAAPLLGRAVAVTREVVGAAGLDPQQLSGLFLVGGATRMPMVARLLHAELGVAPTVLEQPELPVAEGALTDLPLPRRARSADAFAAPAAAPAQPPAPAVPAQSAGAPRPDPAAPAPQAAASTPPDLPAQPGSAGGPPHGSAAPHQPAAPGGGAGGQDGNAPTVPAGPAPTPTAVAGPEGVTPALPVGLAPTMVAGPPTAPTVPAAPSPATPFAPPGAGPSAFAPPWAPGAYPSSGAPAGGTAPYVPPGTPAAGPASGVPAGGGAPPGVPLGGPAGSWSGVPVSGTPVSPSPGGGRSGPALPRRRALWISLAAVLALAGVATAAVLYLTRDRYPALEFRTVDQLTRVPAGTQRPADMFTAVLGDRAYLGYPLDDGRLEVVAIDAGTGAVKWRKQTAASSERWKRIVALPGAVAVFADAIGDDTPRDLVLLDGASGDQRWHRPILGNDDVLFGDGVAVQVDRAGKRLVGLSLGDGREEWTQPSPRDEYDNTRTSVHPVTTDEALGGPAFLDGSPRDPWRGEVSRIVQVGADRSVRLIDMGSGRVVRTRAGVADHDDLVVAHEDRLYVARDDAGYQLLAYDLTSDAQPKVLYTAEDDKRRPEALVPCGERRACLLEVTGGDDETTEVVAATEEKVSRWDAPRATRLVPLGEHLLARRTSPESAGTLFDPDGRAVLSERGGVAVRLDAGNLLLLADPPSSIEDDHSVAGMSVGSGEVAELGQLADVRSDSCSWNTSVIACGAGRQSGDVGAESPYGFVLYRFAE